MYFVCHNSTYLKKIVLTQIPKNEKAKGTNFQDSGITSVSQLPDSACPARIVQ